ncbi:sugar transferase [Fodinicola feengrottensis]|uniref:Sugar transferase n=1 Tax=Fodinicola feengrottensis TaxID=435914 RepID=A0ABN2HIE3_9ACTN
MTTDPQTTDQTVTLAAVRPPEPTGRRLSLTHALAPSRRKGRGQFAFSQAVLAPDPVADVHELPALPVRVEKTDWEQRYVSLLTLVDVAAAVVAAGLGFWIRFGSIPHHAWAYVIGSAFFPAIWLLVLMFARAYESRYLFVGNEEYRRVLNAGLVLTAAVAFVSYVASIELARGYVVVVLPAVTVATLVGRYLLRRWLVRERAHGRCMRRVIVVGDDTTVGELHRQLARHQYHGMQVVGVCVPPQRDGRNSVDGIEVVGTFDTITRAVIDVAADTVAILPCPELSSAMLRRLVWSLESTGTDIIVAGALLDVAGPRTSLRPIDGLPMLHLDHAELAGSRWMIKRLFDVFSASLLLILLSPLLLAVALAIRVTSSGPAFFRQTRVGKDGENFTILKLRTMYLDAESRLGELAALNEHDGLLFKIRHDPRVTPLGRWLRRFSIDELPQLFNVVAGQMSLVGPRPPLPSEVAEYPDDLMRRLVVKPGVTGLWQVSGRADLSWEDSMRLDLRYVENWSLTLDLVVLLRTVTAVVRSAGAY